MSRRETVETYALAAYGALRGAERYYVRPFIADLGTKVVNKLTQGFIPIDLSGLDNYIDEIASYEHTEQLREAA